MDKLRILVTGMNGQLGNSFREIALIEERYSWKFFSRNEVDLSDSGFIAVLKEEDFDILINCAAYTAVDQAESEADLCFRVNRDAVDMMAALCREKRAFFVHFSSDYVYHNNLNRPLREKDKTSPKGVYAQSKLEGENAVKSRKVAGLIIRTSWVYSATGKNFYNTMLRLATVKDTLNIVDDQIGTPTYAPHLVLAVLILLNNTTYIDNLRVANQTEIINFSNEGVASWYDFARTIFEVESIGVQCQPISTAQFPTPASRPYYSVLNKTKIRKLLGHHKIPHWQDAVRECYGQRLKQAFNGR